MLIRYRIGDVGTRLKKPCECGRPGEVFSEVDGRVEDYILTPDGRLVGRLDHIFKEQTDIAEAQIVQDSPDAITILITPRFSYREASQKKLLSQIRDRLGDDLHIDIRLTDSIPREKNGKFRAVKSSIRSHSDV
jgi:phenylacetate-CoA ligase